MTRLVHAFGDDALGEHDAVALVEEIRSGRVSRREVVQAAIDRSNRLDPVLRGVAADRFSTAAAEADTPTDGYFAGVPTYVKDNSDVRGLATQHGTRAFVARAAKADGDVARVLGLLGATVLGKTRLSEFGFSPSAEPLGEDPVRNPWDTAHSSGASSAGAAVLVAAGAVPFAHANDGGGSIRIPAACCGLVGLKPSRGRTPSDRANQEMPVRIVHDGVLTRSVRDTAAFVREAERAYRDLRLPPVGDVDRPGRKRLRVGVVHDAHGGRVTDEETRATVTATARLLEDLGHRVEETALPDPGRFAEDFLLYWASLALFLSRTGKVHFNRSYDRSQNDGLTHGLAQHASRRVWRLPGAIRRLRASQHLTTAMFTDVDVLLTPTLTHTTPRLGWLDPAQPYDTVIERILAWLALTPVQNATGDPAVSLPMGRTNGGLPIGVQLVAPLGEDRRLLELAYELESARPFARIQD